MLKKLLKEDVIKLNVQCDSWVEAIKEGTSLLIHNGYIEKGYEDAIFNNFKEMGTYMVVAPGIALSHARPENGVNRICMSLVTLKKPIEFGSVVNDPVKLVVTFGAKDNQSHLQALAELMDLFMNEEDLKKIMEATEKHEVIRTIEKYCK